jgi:DNA-binding IclR family transcriptional regulator
MGSAHSRAFNILRLLRRSTRPLGLSAIAKEQQLATSSAHAILSELLEVGAVTIDDDKRYWLGPNVFYLGSAFATNSAIYRGAWNELIDLAQELQVSAAIAIPWDRHHLVIAVHRNSGRGPALTPGTRVPLDGGSYGKIYYAMSGEPLPAKTAAQSTVQDFESFSADVVAARETGYAVDNEEFAVGVAALASAITSERGYEGLVALWSSPADKLRSDIGFEKGGLALSELADRVSLVLGDLDRERAWPQAD